jgi:hypothetical protein
MELKAQITEFLESKEMSKTEAESGEIGPMVNDIPLLVIERAHGRVLYPLVYIVPKRLEQINSYITSVTIMARDLKHFIVTACYSFDCHQTTKE